MSTLRDVAKRARVSPMTVSRVANGASGVRPETRRRVEKAIADLGFIPNSVARGLKSSKTGSLGLIVPDIVNPFEHLAVLSPFLTVMNQPAESFGTVAAQLLLDRIAGKAGERRRQVVLQPHLLVRESCGAKVGLPGARPGGQPSD